MKITKDSFVSCSYNLYAGPNQDQIVEQATEEAPLNLIIGDGFLLEAFDESLMGLEAGAPFDIVLTAERAYGESREEYILKLDKGLFVNDEGEFHKEVVYVGNSVPMLDQEGNQLVGIVKEITDSEVTMDFNHPLAGQTLRFVGKVLEVRPATMEDRLMIQAQYAPQGGCGCGCGCGDDESQGGCAGCGGGCC